MVELSIPMSIALAALVLITGRYLADWVRPYSHRPLADVPFLAHARTQTVGPVRVTVSALTPVESAEVFGAPLALCGIQPVWIEVENHDTVPLLYLRAGTDQEWFSPYEAFWLNRFRVRRPANRLMQDRFYELAFENPVMPGTTSSGFVYTRLDEGLKAVDLDLVGPGNSLYSFALAVPIPGFRGDFKRREGNETYSEGELVRTETDQDFRAALAELPACTTNRNGTGKGDPLNVVLVGDRQLILSAFTRRGWHPTEQTYYAAVWRTIRSAIFRSPYRYSPVSPLYALGRSQDIAAQKARGSVHLRNHARFWVTPIRFHGAEVWLGQISRDIGVRLVVDFPPTTHKIDPDVDEARDGLVQDMAYSQTMGSFAWVRGVGKHPRDEPGFNLTGDPFFTDGHRAVLFFEPRPFQLGEIEVRQWDATEVMRRAAGVEPGA